MPRVPIFSTTPQIQGPPQFSAPGVAQVRSSAGQQAQDVGAGLQSAGQGVVSIGERLKYHFDLAQAKRADNIAEEVIRNGLLEYTNKLGKDATGEGRRLSFEPIKKKLDELSASLGSPEQRKLFKSSVDQRMSDAAYKADLHESKQVFAFEMAESQVRADGFIASAVNAPPGTDEFDTYRANAIGELNIIANRLGLPVGSEQRNSLIEAKTTELHAKVIDRLLNDKDFEGATRHYQDNLDEISPAVRPKIDEVLQKAGIEDKANKMHQEFLQSGLNPLQMLMAADAYVEGGVISVAERDVLMERAAKHDNFVTTQKARMANDALEVAKNAALQGAELTPQDRVKLSTLGVLDDYLAWQGDGKTNKTSDYGILFKQQAHDSPNTTFGQYNDWPDVFREMRKHLSNADLDVVHAQWRRYKGLDAPEDGVKVEVDLLLRNAMRDMGILPAEGSNTLNGMPNPKERVAIDRFTQDFLTRMSSSRLPMTYPNALKIINEMKDEAKKLSSGAPASTTPGPVLQGAIWTLTLKDSAGQDMPVKLPVAVVNHYREPAMKSIVEQRMEGMIKSGVTPWKARENALASVTETDIVEMVARYQQDTNATNEADRALARAQGTKMLVGRYRTKLNNTMIDLAQRRQEQEEMLRATGQPVTGLGPEMSSPALAYGMHEQVRDELIAQLGQTLAVKYHLTVDEMNQMLDKIAPPAPQRGNGPGLLGAARIGADVLNQTISRQVSLVNEGVSALMKGAEAAGTWLITPRGRGVKEQQEKDKKGTRE